jgi:hypothetical protein
MILISFGHQYALVINVSSFAEPEKMIASAGKWMLRDRDRVRSSTIRDKAILRSGPQQTLVAVELRQFSHGQKKFHRRSFFRGTHGSQIISKQS